MTVAADGCWPFFFPVDPQAQFLGAEVERDGEHGVVRDGGPADRLLPPRSSRLSCPAER
jgi:hypothetical protein